MFRTLDMKPKRIPRGRLGCKATAEANWFEQPWKIEGLDPKNLAHVLASGLVVGEDGEILQDRAIADEVPP
jgi:hypothetical protein